MRTEDAVTGAGGLWFVFGGAVVLYAALGTRSPSFALRRIARREEPGADIGAGLPYGPPPSAAEPKEEAADEQARRRRRDPRRRSDPLRDLRRRRLRRRRLGAARGRGRPTASLRERIEQRVALSLGPVWEANHVWLIFTLVVLWTGFPDAFAPIMETLYVPLALAAVGIVLRGSGFAFGHSLRRRRGAARPRRLRGLVADHAVLPRLRGRRDRRRRRRGRRLRRRARLDRAAADPRRRPVRRELRLHRRRLPARRLPPRRRRGARASTSCAARSPPPWSPERSPRSG